MQSFAVVEHGGVEYLSLHQVLKDVAAVRKLWIVACPCFLHFAYDIELTYIRKRRRYTEFWG